MNLRLTDLTGNVTFLRVDDCCEPMEIIKAVDDPVEWAIVTTTDHRLEYIDGLAAIEHMADGPFAVACTVAECTRCGVLDCPDGEPFHYHHDGCPACADGLAVN